MVDLTLLVGNAAVVCTVASNFAGLPTCLDMVRKKSTSGVSALPFLCGAVCSSLWLQYGVLVGDGVVMMVNFMAVFLQCCYLGCFCYATLLKAFFAQCVASCAFLLLSVHVYSFYVADTPTAVQTVGLLSCGSSVAMCASPLAGLVSDSRCLAIRPCVASHSPVIRSVSQTEFRDERGSPKVVTKRDVLRTRSTRSLPFLIIASTFVTMTLWCVYGILVADSFIKIPNLIGALLSGFQLSLFAVFDSAPTRPKED